MISKIIKAFFPPIIVLVVHIFLVSILNLYHFFPWVDIPMHFIGGSSVAWTFTTLLAVAKNKKLLGKNHKLVNFLFVLSLVALTAIFWEFFEYLLAIFTDFRWQNTLPDTILDFLMGLLGTPLGFLIAKKQTA